MRTPPGDRGARRSPGTRVRSGLSRSTRAWSALHPDQRLAGAAAAGLFVSMLLPWYTKTDTVVVGDAPRSIASAFTAFGEFSFVEAAVLLVSAFVLMTLFARAEQRAFHLPGGDGLDIMLAGAWSAILIFYRMLDKPALRLNEVISATEGISWGIFVALLLALALALAGWRIHASGRAEPPVGASRAPRPRSGASPPTYEDETRVTPNPPKDRWR